VINYSCDRCRCPLEAPLNSTINNPMPTIKEARKGVEMLLPNKSSVGYSFVFTHLCETCLSELAAWKFEKMSRVDQSMLDDR